MKTIFIGTLVVILCFAGGGASCGARPGSGGGNEPATEQEGSRPAEGTTAPAEANLNEVVQRSLRHAMVHSQIHARGIDNERVLAAMRKVPRHLFVPESVRDSAYEDRPLPIGEGQTISQPYIVALMTDLARPRAGERVLEIGTGSGYQAAVLAELGPEVYTIEIVEPLAARATDLLRSLSYAKVHTRVGDGYRGWPEKAPFDAIVVTAAPETIPQPLKDQLRVGGRLVIPVGASNQELRLVTRTKDGFHEERVIPVRFVPMTGEAQRPR